MMAARVLLVEDEAERARLPAAGVARGGLRRHARRRRRGRTRFRGPHASWVVVARRARAGGRGVGPGPARLVAAVRRRPDAAAAAASDRRRVARRVADAIGGTLTADRRPTKRGY